MTVENVPDQGVDLGRLQAEIAEEVRHRRATGDFPPGLERELDAMFARYAPASASDDFDDVLAFAETQSFIHADVPTASRRPPLAVVKRVLRKFMGWYVRFVTQQVTGFAGAITRAVSLLSRRVDALETATAVADERALAYARTARPDLSVWADVVVGAMGGVTGRVLHAEAGIGGLVHALVGAGVDGYGIEPAEDDSLVAARAGLDDDRGVQPHDADVAARRLDVDRDALLPMVVLQPAARVKAEGDAVHPVEQRQLGHAESHDAPPLDGAELLVAEVAVGAVGELAHATVHRDPGDDVADHLGPGVVAHPQLDRFAGLQHRT